LEFVAARKQHHIHAQEGYRPLRCCAQDCVRFCRAPPRTSEWSYRYVPLDTVVADFGAFSNMTIEDVEAHIGAYHRDIRREWRALHGVPSSDAPGFSSACLPSSTSFTAREHTRA